MHATIASSSPRHVTDLRIDNLLESKLSETIPVRPEHKDLMEKRSKVNLKSFADKLDRKGINLSVRGVPSKTRHNIDSPFLQNV